MRAYVGVRASSSSSSSSSLKSSSSFRTTLFLSISRRLLSLGLLRTGKSRSAGSCLGGGLRLLFLSRSSFCCFSISRRHRLVCWVNSLAILLYALSSSLVALGGSNLLSATASFTLAIDSLDKYIRSLGGYPAAAAMACRLLLDGWLPFWLLGLPRWYLHRYGSWFSQLHDHLAGVAGACFHAGGRGVLACV